MRYLAEVLVNKKYLDHDISKVYNNSKYTIEKYRYNINI